MIQLHKAGSVQLLGELAHEKKNVEARIVQEIGEQPKCGVLERTFLGRVFLSLVNPFYDSNNGMDRALDRRDYFDRARDLRNELYTNEVYS